MICEICGKRGAREIISIACMLMFGKTNVLSRVCAECEKKEFFSALKYTYKNINDYK